MTPRTRYFVFGSVAVLLVGLCTGLVAYYSGLPMGAFGRTDTPAELSYVPADAAVVAYCNVQDVMHSQLRQQLQKKMPDREEGQQEFERETGLNIERDIDRVVGFLVPTGTRDSYRGMVLASGRFDAVRLEGLAREHGGEVTEYKGKRLITRAADEETGEGVPKSMSVAFLAPSTPPLTGQSRKPPPAAATCRAAVRAVSAATVEQSMTTAPGLSAGQTASTTASRSPSAETQVTTASQDDASSAGDPKARQPVSAAKAAAFEAVRFQMPARRLARCRLRAMCWPMAPRPMNPAFMAGSIVPAARGQLQKSTTSCLARARASVSSLSVRYTRLPSGVSR